MVLSSKKCSPPKHTAKGWYGYSRARTQWATAIWSLGIGRAIRTIKMVILFNSLALRSSRCSRHFHHVREPVMADNCITCDVAIVGSGFAGSFIANELIKLSKLNKKDINVVILEAGQGVQPNFNAFMKTFYEASAKVPESPYPPAVFDSKGKFIDPANVAAGRPSALTTGSNWKDPKQAYLDQKGKRPFKSTYERLAGGTSHWMALTPRLVPNDFLMKTTYGQNQPDFPLPDWPIKYEDLLKYYDKAEAELGVAADVDEQRFANLSFSPNYTYPMPRIPQSLFDQRVDQALAHLTEAETKFLGTSTPVTGL